MSRQMSTRKLRWEQSEGGAHRNEPHEAIPFRLDLFESCKHLPSSITLTNDEPHRDGDHG